MPQKRNHFDVSKFTYTMFSISYTLPVSPIFLQQISCNSCIFEIKSLCQAWCNGEFYKAVIMGLVSGRAQVNCISLS